MNRLFAYLAFIALLAALITPLGTGVAAQEEEPPEDPPQTLVAETEPVVEEEPPAEIETTVEEPVAEAAPLPQDTAVGAHPGEPQIEEELATEEMSAISEPPLQDETLDGNAGALGDESLVTDETSGQFADTAGAIVEPTFEESQSVQAQALEVGDPDPNVSVEIAGLTIDCTGAFSFSTVVNITYRWEGHFFVDIYFGDPDAGGVPHAVFAIDGDETLYSGTNHYATQWTLATVNTDPYVQIRWFATAWDGESALDYVGEWRGREKASAGGCDTETPPPVNDRVSSLALTCAGFLTFTSGMTDLYLLYLVDGSVDPPTFITTSGVEAFSEGANQYQFTVEEGVYDHLIAEIREYSVTSPPELLGTATVTDCITSDEEPGPAPVGGPVPTEGEQLPNAQAPLSVGYQLGRSTPQLIPYIGLSNPVATCGWQNCEYVVDINPVQVGAWALDEAVADQNVSIEIMWAGIISGSSWFALDSTSVDLSLTSGSPFFTTNPVQFRTNYFQPYPFDGMRDRTDTYVIVIVDWPAGTLRYPVAVHNCVFSADPGTGGEDPDPGEEPTGNTQPGENVAVTSQSGSVTFDDVTGAGETTISLVDVDAVPALPDGFLRVGGQFYEIDTTATFDGSVAICLAYDPDAFSDVTELTLLHHSGGAWQDITTSNDTVGGVICGAVTDLSPFSIVESVSGETGSGEEPGKDPGPEDSTSGESSNGGYSAASGSLPTGTAEASSSSSNVTVSALPKTGSGATFAGPDPVSFALLIVSLMLLSLAVAARCRQATSIDC